MAEPLYLFALLMKQCSKFSWLGSCLSLSLWWLQQVNNIIKRQIEKYLRLLVFHFPVMNILNPWCSLAYVFQRAPRWAGSYWAVFVFMRGKKWGQRTDLSGPGRQEPYCGRIMCFPLGFYYLEFHHESQGGLKSYIEAKSERKTRTKKSAGQGAGLA